jgi:outer membrane lipoprotein SlyB
MISTSVRAAFIATLLLGSAGAQTSPTATPNLNPALPAAANGQTTPAPTLCSQCGTVTSVTAKKTKGKATWMGTVGGAVVGGAVGNQVGSGDGKKVATIVGAAGGAMVGREAEKRLRKKDVTEIVVRMDDGSSRVLLKEIRPAIQPGDKVKVIGEDVFVR